MPLQFMKTMIQVELIGRDIVLCLEEDLPDSVLRQPGFNRLEVFLTY